jgi:hypothetical protein
MAYKNPYAKSEIVKLSKGALPYSKQPSLKSPKEGDHVIVLEGKTAYRAVVNSYRMGMADVYITGDRNDGKGTFPILVQTHKDFMYPITQKAEATVSNLNAIAAELEASGIRCKVVTAKTASADKQSNEQFDCLSEIVNTHPKLHTLRARFGEKVVDALSHGKLFTIDDDRKTTLTRKGAVTLKKEMIARWKKVRDARNKGFKK